MMPNNLHELTEMIAKRDGISFRDAAFAVRECADEMEQAFFDGDLDAAEDALKYHLGLEPDYLEIFIC